MKLKKSSQTGHRLLGNGCIKRVPKATECGGDKFDAYSKIPTRLLDEEEAPYPNT
jgi:hypothetical protein